jgi:hypothetical protein
MPKENPVARFPGAIWRPIPASKGRKALTVHNRVNLHVAVSEAASLHGAFNKTGQVDSHFYVRRDGTVEQYVDTSERAFADLDGNDATISIETQGGFKNADTEPWTPEQLETLAQLYAWAVTTHGVAQQIASTSQTNASSRGLSWHRLGIDGNFPNLPDARAGRTQRGGGMHYSKSRGKLCPGGGKIGQIPGVFARAQAILGGVETVDRPIPAPASPAPAPAPSGLAVDGDWGAATTTRLQQVLGTAVDGAVSSQDAHWSTRNPGLTTGWGWVASRSARGSLVIAALQRRLGVRDDGLIGPATISALQRHLGTPADGVISRHSRAVIALQTRLNEGTI